MENIRFISKMPRKLRTHTQFDGSVIENTGLSQFPTSHSALVANLTSVAPSSLLSLALLHKLCCDSESDFQRRNELFLAVCDKFYREKYLDESCVLFCDVIVKNPNFGERIALYVKEMQRAFTNQFETPIKLLPSISHDSQSPSTPSDIYSDTFEEIDEIAEGGFGTVVKAKHKVDGVIYAVKKINFKFKNNKDYEKVLQEVKSLAKLKHPNIVNYNNSWLQFRDTKSLSSGTPDTEIEDSESSEYSKNLNNSSSDVSSTSNNKIFSVTLSSQNSQESSNHSPRSALFTDLPCPKKNAKDIIPNIIIEESEDDKNIIFEDYKLPVLQQTLFIQMEYCDCDLRFLLDNRGEESGKEVWKILDPLNIFHQVLNGVSHIHSNKVIHRDLKPKNIFVSKSNGSVKIGDFGLSCLVPHIDHEHSGSGACSCPFRSLSAIAGTPPYSAPEQKSGKDYDFKVDIYSLGIILFELLHPCHTVLELAKELEKIAETAEYPKDLDSQSVNLMKKMTMRDPAKRPDASEILKLPIFKKKSLKNKIADIKLAISKLKSDIVKQEQLMNNLQEEQAALSMQLTKISVEKDAKIKLLEERIKSLTEVHLVAQASVYIERL